MSWIDPKSKLSSLIKEAEEIVTEDRRLEFAKAEEVRLAAELKAKQQVEAKAKAEEETKSKAEAEAEARAKAEEEAKASASKDKKTISCVKGKLTKKVTAVSPKCSKGYKKK